MSAQPTDEGHNGEGWKKVGWTLRYPELGTGPVSYEDSISPEFFELEREAIFRRQWLNVGHVSDVPSVGSYFTRELPVCRTSIIVARGADNVIRAFHNVCPHRGNKLVWTERPTLESSGTTRLFRCRYHGWSFELNGKCRLVTDEAAFFDLDKSQLDLNAVHCAVWKGWIFVNFAQTPATTVEEAMGEIGEGVGDYPFERFDTSYKYLAELDCNWKVVTDAFLETYHSAYLHAPVRNDFQEGAVLNHTLDFYADSKGNRMAGYYGADANFRSPVQRVLNVDLFGPSDSPDLGYRSLQELPSGLNRARHPNWGMDQLAFHPNFQIQVWRRNWVAVLRMWPVTCDRTQFEVELRFVRPTTARQRLAQELMRTIVKDFILQDLNLLGGTYQMLQSRVRSQYYLGDEEFLVRHFHSTIARDVESYRASLR